MSSLNSRLVQLEKQQPDQARQYLCIIHPDHEGEGYKVTDMQGGGSSPQTFATLEELQAFGARPDVDLLIVEIAIEQKE